MPCGKSNKRAQKAASIDKRLESTGRRQEGKKYSEKKGLSREKRQGRREQTEERSEGTADRGTKDHESLLKVQGMVGRAGVVPGRSAWCRKGSFA